MGVHWGYSPRRGYEIRGFDRCGDPQCQARREGSQAAGCSTDQLSGIDNLTGSTYHDKLTGDAGANVLNGGDGDDSLSGGASADILIGGTDSPDRFSFGALPDGGSFCAIADFRSGADMIGSAPLCSAGSLRPTRPPLAKGCWQRAVPHRAGLPALGQAINPAVAASSCFPPGIRFCRCADHRLTGSGDTGHISAVAGLIAIFP